MAQFIFCITLTVFTFQGTFCMTSEQRAMIHEQFERVGMKCIQEYTITENDITDLRAKRVPVGENTPCFIACMFKQLGIMDESGMIQKETALDLVKKVFTDKEELDLIEDYLHSCSHINSEPVSDGVKGCERAMLGFKCMLENASKFGFEL